MITRFPRAAALAAALALCAAGPALAAEPAHGLWKTETSDEGRYLHVRLGPCDGDPSLTCGIVAEAFNTPGSDIVGKPMIFDMAAEGDGKYGDGKIWAPDDDKTYGAGMEMKGADVLRVEGCVFVFCRGQDWTRVE